MAVTDEAIEKIKGMIVSGALRPGDRLPKESELAAGLGLSRNSPREAVRALFLIRALDVRPGDGTYVTSPDPQLLLTAPSFVVDFHRDDTVLEFLAVRRILEPAATAMACAHITDTGLAAPSEQLAAPGSAGNSVLCSLLDGPSGPTTRARVRRGPPQEDAVGRTLRNGRAPQGDDRTPVPPRPVRTTRFPAPSVGSDHALPHARGLRRAPADAVRLGRTQGNVGRRPG